MGFLAPKTPQLQALPAPPTPAQQPSGSRPKQLSTTPSFLSQAAVPPQGMGKTLLGQ